MKLRARLLVGVLKKYGLRALKKRKHRIIQLLNEKIDLPKLNEKQEEKLLVALFNVIIEVLENL